MNRMDIQTQPISLLYSVQMEAVRKRYGNKLSANVFSSLYIWQEQMGLSVLLDDDFFAVKCAVRGADTWFFPCGSKQETARFIRAGMQRRDFSLCYIGEQDAAWLKEAFPGQWELRREEASDEYICRMAELIGLRGGKFTGVRHKINRIERENLLETRPLSDATVQDALAVVDEWAQQPHSVGCHQLAEGGVSHRALLERESLGLDGVVVYANGTPSAVFAGFPIDETTVDAQVGQCRNDAPRGFVYYAVREYFRQNQGRYTYCNLEEDLGIPGIRLIKEALRPESKNLMWTAVQV